jgi:CheY-like chemotaxis protein
MGQVSILLVEDHADTRALIQVYLEQQGFAVVAAGDGAEALGELSGRTPDLILTDLMMPRVSGLELIRRVRERAELRHVPIVAMTAFGEGGLRLAKAAGADATFSKDSEPGLLADILKRALVKP